MIICWCFVWMFLLKTNKCYEKPLEEDYPIPVVKSNNNTIYGIDTISNYTWFNKTFKINGDSNAYYPLVNECVLKETDKKSIDEMIYLSKTNYNKNSVYINSLFGIFNLTNYAQNFTFKKENNMLTVTVNSDNNDKDIRKIACTPFNTHDVTIKDNWNCLIRKINNISKKNLTALFTTGTKYIHIHETHKFILENYVNKRKSCSWMNLTNSTDLTELHDLHPNNANTFEIYRCDNTISLTRPFRIEFSPYIQTFLSQEALTTRIDDSIYFNIVVDNNTPSDRWMLGMSFIQEHNITLVTGTGEVLFIIQTNKSYCIINVFLTLFVIILSTILFISFNCCCYKKKSK